jgi:2-polyprenyl-3-methyl-5-hydroxy-6-metoxy-1,4-benzoquinol methylase
LKCRHCNAILNKDLIDLGVCSPSNAYVKKNELKNPKKTFPLRVKICSVCYLVQTEDYTKSKNLFTDDYAYLSSVSKTLQKHCKVFSDKIIKKLSLNNNSFVLEVASNDGCLLEYFHKKKIKTLGIEPTKIAAKLSKKKGINTIEKFFNTDLAKKLVKKYGKADLVCANNVFAHVPDINNFVKALKIILSKNGTITIEFPHLLNLVKNTLFDTIYHEHFSYLSLYTTNKIVSRFGLKIFDVEQINTHGGSLRVFLCHDNSKMKINARVKKFLFKEQKFGLFKMTCFNEFKKKVKKIQTDLMIFLTKLREDNKNVVAYGAAAKGNTLLNSIGVTKKFIKYVCDEATSKQGKFLPGSLIPIVNKKKLMITQPDVILILPWNLSKEISQSLKFTKQWNCKLYVALPKLKEIR